MEENKPMLEPHTVALVTAIEGLSIAIKTFHAQLKVAGMSDKTARLVATDVVHSQIPEIKDKP